MKCQGKQFRALVLMVALCGFSARAQQQQNEPQPAKPAQPLPAASTGKIYGKADADTTDQQGRKNLEPDTRPLTGAEQFSLGMGGARTYLAPALHFRQSADTNSSSAPGGGTDIDAATSIFGDITLHHLWKSAEFAAGYAGGGTFYNTRSENQTFHSVSLSQRFAWGRWAFLLTDQATYLPESAFGYGNIGPWGGLRSGLGGLVGQLSGLNPIFNPNQSIFTGQARRISNVVLGELQYSLSPRSVVTASASYGLLHFLESGFVDSNQVMFRGGYSYLLNRQDTIGLVYGFSRFRFDATRFRTDNHTVHLAYGRRVTGRLALQLFGGPEIRRLRNIPSGTDTEISWSVGTLARYQFPRADFSLTYIRGTTSGAGVFTGATSDDIQASVGRRITRNWGARFNMGYARHEGFEQILVFPSNFHFNSWYVGGDLNRTLGRRMNTYFTYRFHHQNSDTTFCFTGTCGTSFRRHVFGIGFDWNLRPIEMN